MVTTRKYLVFMSIFVVGLMTICIPCSNAVDSDHDGLDDADEQVLAEQFAPILYFEKNEQLFPVNAQYAIGNSNLNRSQDGSPILVDANPTAEKLGTYTNIDANYYLDNKKGTIDDDGIIDDYENQREALGYTVYSHVFTSASETYVQYWMFYAFNKGSLNTHEGDWEMIQLVLDENDKPVRAMYSQHHSGQQASWGRVQKSGDHPKVYVAQGSHANYFRYYQGKLGFASDSVGKNGKVLKPDDYTLILLGEIGASNHVASQNWIDFAGRWGDWGGTEDDVRGKRGPEGPAYREDGAMWDGVIWGSELPSLNSNFLMAEWVFYNFVVLYLVVLAVSLALIIYGIYRRNKKESIKKPYLFLLQIDGTNLRSIGNVLAIIAMVLAVTALFFQWYAVSVDIQAGAYTTPGSVDIISIDGKDGVQVNLLEEGSGLVQIGAFPIAFSLLLAAAVIFFVLGTVGLVEKKAGRKYILRGIRFLVPVILIIIAVTAIGVLAFQINESGAPETVKDDAKEILKTISSQPFGGAKTLNLPDYGHVDVSWGLGLGSYLLIAACALFIVAGVLVRRDTEKKGN